MYKIHAFQLENVCWWKKIDQRMIKSDPYPLRPGCNNRKCDPPHWHSESSWMMFGVGTSQLCKSVESGKPEMLDLTTL